MQDPQTGNMIEIGQESTQQAEKLGFCVLTVGESINLKNTDLKVYDFDTKHIMLEFSSNDFKRPFKIGEHITIKNGTFVVESYGAKFLKLRGIPAVRTLSQDVIDEYKKLQVKNIRESN